MEDALKKFAQENFSHKYYPTLHGERDLIQPMTLVVKRKRPKWKRPFAKLEVIVIAPLAKYGDNGNEFEDFVKSKIRKEKFEEKQNIGMGTRSQEYGASVSHLLGETIKLNNDQGVLHLGTISQKYVDDPDLREILSRMTLDDPKMKSFEGDELLLITSVIYSEKFELVGKRKQEVQCEISGDFPSSITDLFNRNRQRTKANAHFKDMNITPDIASRNSESPFLFKCCHLDYMKADNRLVIRKGDYVGKVVTGDVFDQEETKEDIDYNDTDGLVY